MDILRDQGFEVPEYLLSASNYGKGRKIENVQQTVLKEDESEKADENEDIARTENEDIAETLEEDDDCVPRYDGELKLEEFIPGSQEDDEEIAEQQEDHQGAPDQPEAEEEEQEGSEQVESLDKTKQAVAEKVLKLDRLDRLENLEKLNRLDNLDATLNSYETKQQENENTQRGVENAGLVCPLCGINPNTPAKLREHMAYKHFTENIKARFMKDERRCLVDDCTKEFTNLSSLVRHIGSTHNKVWKLFNKTIFHIEIFSFQKLFSH